MSNDKAAIAAWAARKKQRKLEAQALTKALQAKVDEQKFAPLTWESFPVVHIPEVKAPWVPAPVSLAPPTTLPKVKGLSFDSAKGMYRCRAYKNNRQLNLYWGPSLTKALEAIEEYRISGVNPNS